LRPQPTGTNAGSYIHVQLGGSHAGRFQPERERQYEHVKDSVKQRGGSTRLAEEIAARTVNKEWARSGESKTASRSSVKDVSSGQRGGKRSHSGA